MVNGQSTPVISRNPAHLFANVGDLVVVLVTSADAYFQLNETASCIWTLLATPRSLDEVAVALQREFKVEPDVCRATLTEFFASPEGATLFCYDGP
ncbi:MAG TPA: PqqD family protein [Vicinamibacterales bacterium]|nr:PqqD family protein [Vicinamibacterales bacterium]